MSTPVRHCDNPMAGTHYACGALCVNVHWVFFVADLSQSTVCVWDSLTNHRLSQYAAHLATLTTQLFRITAPPAASGTGKRVTPTLLQGGGKEEEAAKHQGGEGNESPTPKHPDKKQDKGEEKEATKPKDKDREENNPRPRFSWRLARNAIQQSNGVDCGVCVIQHLLAFAKAPHEFFKAASGRPTLSASSTPTAPQLLPASESEPTRKALYDLATIQLSLEAQTLRLERSLYNTVWPAEQHVLEKRSALRDHQEGLGRCSRAVAAVGDTWSAARLEYTEEGRDRKKRRLNDCVDLSLILEEEEEMDSWL